MKRILITGANSYIGTSFEKYMAQWPNEYQVDTIDMVDGSWREKSFTGYDSVFHVAGIAHINTKKLDKAARDNYWKVNAELPIEVAKKAKADGVKQIIFLSSMSVYGEHGSIKKPVVITRETRPNPKDIYGKSKLAAEEGIVYFRQKGLTVAVLRPPIIYGPSCKGNYTMLSNFAKKRRIFPDIENQRSMLFIGNLAEIVKEIIDHNLGGVFLPHNSEYVSTKEMVREIANVHGHNVRFTRCFNPLIMLFSGHISVFDKVFGSLVYDLDSSDSVNKYGLFDSVRISENLKER